MNDSVANWVAETLKDQPKSVTFTPLTPDASFRRYYRVTAKGQSYVLCCNSKALTDEDSFLRLQKIWQQYHIRVPGVIAVNLELGLLLQSDLGDVSLQSYLAEGQDVWTSSNSILPSINLDQRFEVTCRVVDDIQNIFKLPKSEYPLLFDRSKLGFEWGWTWQHLFEPVLTKPIALSVYSSWQHATLLNSKLLESHARVPTHRDLHSRNIMMVGQIPYYIDFQDGRLGTIYYDLVSLIYDSYLPFDHDFEERVLNYFHQQSGAQFDQTLYFEQVLQRTLKAAGSFASFYRLNQDARYCAYINPTLRLASRALDQLAHPEYAVIKNLVDQTLKQDDYGNL